MWFRTKHLLGQVLAQGFSWGLSVGLGHQESLGRVGFGPHGTQFRLYPLQRCFVQLFANSKNYLAHFMFYEARVQTSYQIEFSLFRLWNWAMSSMILSQQLLFRFRTFFIVFKLKRIAYVMDWILFQLDRRRGTMVILHNSFTDLVTNIIYL